jgi:uncharacterized phage-associated protein
MNKIGFNYKKATQSLNYFAIKESGTVSYMKAIKLLYFSERYHLRKYGRLITNDTYWAMKKGPVASTSLNIAKADDDNLTPIEKEYGMTFIKSDLESKTISSLLGFDDNEFSETEVESLDFAYSNLGKNDQWFLAELSHEYPEWSKYKDHFEESSQTSFSSRYMIDFLDFFSEPENFNEERFGKDVFAGDDMEEKNLAQAIYNENLHIANILS